MNADMFFNELTKEERAEWAMQDISKMNFRNVFTKAYIMSILHKEAHGEELSMDSIKTFVNLESNRMRTERKVDDAKKSYYEAYLSYRQFQEKIKGGKKYD